MGLQAFKRCRRCAIDGGGLSERGLCRIGLIGWLALAGSLALLLTVATGPAQGIQRVEPPRETIIYTSLQPPNWDLYLFGHPGSRPRRLTKDPGLDYNGVVSPDGRWVVFTTERDGTADLYALDRHGTGGAQPLIAGPAMEDAAAFSPDGRQLLFVSTRDGSADIFVTPFRPDQPSASEARNLTRHPAGDYNPVFSPDGTRIVFSSSRDTTTTRILLGPTPTYFASDVYVMEADGTDVRRLTQHERWDGAPAWTPDGRAIVFYSQRDGETRLYRTGVDGAGAEPISAADEAALSPTFGPDGRLAFAVRRDDRWRIVTTESDGTDLRVVSDAARDYMAPAYDPVSGQLLAHGKGPIDSASRFGGETPGAFRMHRPAQVELADRRVSLIGIRGYLPAVDRTSGDVAAGESVARLMVTRPDGTGRRVIFDHEEGDRGGYQGPNSAWGPTWSHDGQWLAYAVGKPFQFRADEDHDIWKVRADGSGAVNLTPDSDTNESFPDFSPDGRHIFFRSMRDGNSEIYVMNADGTDPRRLTHHEATDTMPAVSYAGDRIAFVSRRDGNYEIYIMAWDPNGAPGPPVRMTRHPGHDLHPRFSPGDEWLVFTSARGEFSDELPLLQQSYFHPQPYGELFAMRLADGTIVRLTHNKWEDGPSLWVGDVPGLN